MHKSALIFLSSLVASVGSATTLTVTIDFNTLPATHESGSYGTSNATYNGDVSSTINGIPNELLICDDSAHTTGVPSHSIVYDYETLTSPTPLMDGSATVRFTAGNAALGVNETQAYETAAVLLTELAALHSPSASTITDYQYALWNMFTPTDLSVNSTQMNLQTSAVTLVKAGAASTVADYSNLVIYTPSSAYSSYQEFLGLNTPTPEPASWAFMGLAALLLCIPQFRSRLRQAVPSHS